MSHFDWWFLNDVMAVNEVKQSRVTDHENNSFGFTHSSSFHSFISRFRVFVHCILSTEWGVLLTVKCAY